MDEPQYPVVEVSSVGAALIFAPKAGSPPLRVDLAPMQFRWLMIRARKVENELLWKRNRVT